MQKDLETWHNRKVITLIFTAEDHVKLSIPNIIEDELLSCCKASDALIAELHRIINFMIHYTGTSVMVALQTAPVKLLKSTNHFTKWQILFLK